MAARHALLIATETYTDPALRRLTAPGGDARALAEVLSDPEIAGFEVTTLVDQPHHVVGEAIGEFYRGRRRDELTLLYFTGHGVKDDDGSLYLAMANTRRDSLMFTALAAEQVDRAMAGCASRQKVLVLDCCYSGAFPSGKLAKAGTDVHTLERFQGRGRAVLTASDATQYSFEGDSVVGSAARSVFTRHLVAGLRDGSADLDGDGDVTVDELYSYVHEHVVAEMPRQRPKHQSDVEGRIVLARNPHWTLPEYLRHGLASPIAADRLTALEGSGAAQPGGQQRGEGPHGEGDPPSGGRRQPDGLGDGPDVGASGGGGDAGHGGHAAATGRGGGFAGCSGRLGRRGGPGRGDLGTSAAVGC
ncbi:caspase family protein [Amycolatopsis sp. WQ 127309]|uniref:caspase family protein n=1 Tax=Amycolatopsis sp. WQ 127309 TaxID=2932773 RepID=UPI001FF3F377|nr:caspase family protein [Amycolatopsis sp. WQ 127309]UOZ10433.1 caspase family protein [Amycolatopsis sp. WQ 127309]